MDFDEKYEMWTVFVYMKTPKGTIKYAEFSEFYFLLP